MKKALSLAISLGLLAVIYWKIDLARLGAVFAQSDPLWMALSLGMVVPLTLFTAWRLQMLMPRGGGAGCGMLDAGGGMRDAGSARTEEALGIEHPHPAASSVPHPASSPLTFGEATKLILAASVLNLVLPSKMGDLAKAWFMRDRGNLDGSLALSLVVFEKACDMLSLLLWCAFGLALYPRKDALFWTMTAGVAVMLAFGVLLLASVRFAGFFFENAARFAPLKIAAKLAKLAASWAAMHAYFWSSKERLAAVTLMSVFIWFLHLLQIWMFILALRASAPFLASLALSPLAILAGLLPLTFAGVGTRDAALVFFYAPYFAAPTAAALGLLCTARYLLPALGGLPFAGQYLSKVRGVPAR